MLKKKICYQKNWLIRVLQQKPYKIYTRYHKVNLMIHISLKKHIHNLSYLLFVFTFLSMSFEIALKSGSASSFGGLFMPVMNSFYWPRFFIFLMPSIILIISINKKQYERILKGLFLMAAPIVASVSISLFSSYQIITPFDQPEQFWTFGNRA